jgi:putative RNA 2'-phosphotransferase
MNTEERSSDDQATILDDADAERLSRFLALVLRHRAYQFQLDVDDEGFVSIDDLLDVIDERQRSLDWVEFEHIEALASNQGRKRFEVRGDRVRATYGHSFRKPVRYPPADPPEHLFIGMSRGRLLELRTHGLRPDRRHYVHLSEEKDEALEVGKHHDNDVAVITVNARKASQNGTEFYRPTEGIYLTSRVPPEFLETEMAYGRAPRKSRRRR